MIIFRTLFEAISMETNNISIQRVTVGIIDETLMVPEVGGGFFKKAGNFINNSFRDWTF